MLCTTGCFVVNSSPPPQGKLEVISHELIEEELGTKVQATVKNVGSSSIELAEVTVRFYDEDMTLLGTSTDAVMNLEPNRSWTFELPCSGVGCDRVKTYEIETMAGTSSGTW